MTSSRYLRQLALGRRVSRSLREGAPLNVPALTARLDQIHNVVHGALYTACVERWHAMIAQGDVDAISAVLSEDSEESGRMRTVSPFTGLLAHR